MYLLLTNINMNRAFSAFALVIYQIFAFVVEDVAYTGVQKNGTCAKKNDTRCKKMTPVAKKMSPVATTKKTPPQKK